MYGKEGVRMKYYCIGIKGTGMSTLAQILSDLGNEVSGYDDMKEYKFTQAGLEERNIPIYYDQSRELEEDMIVTHSMAISPDHKELERVREKGLTIKKYSEIVGSVINMFDTIAVAGTHGKTTTSSMVRRILEDSIGCNYFIGSGDGFAKKENKYFVIESDEFNKHFLDYHPKYAIITNVEKEHMECYKDLQDIIDSFSRFANQTDNFVIACGDDENIRKLKTNTQVLYYGFDEENDIVVKNVSFHEEGSEFDIYLKEEKIGHFNVPLYGAHMVLDAAAAIFMGYKLGLDVEKMEESLAHFQNAKRRFAEEVVGETVIIDDYAHHPTEIKKTLEAVRQKYPNRKIAVVFKPNTYSRTKDFTKEFIEALDVADKAYVTEITCDREKPEDYPGISSHLLVEGVKNGTLLTSDSDMTYLKEEKGSVVCFMSCASVTHLIENFKESIQ